MRKGKLLLSILLVAVMGLMSGNAISAPYTDGEQTQDGWKSIGPDNYSGRSRAAFFDKFNKDVVYVGTVGGLYVSVNKGKNFQEIVFNPSEVLTVTAIAQDDDGVLYIGTGEGFYPFKSHGENPTGRSNYTSGKVGGGVFKQNKTEKEWTAQFNAMENISEAQRDSLKYEYIRNNFSFTVMEGTTPANKYKIDDDWAYINTMLYANNTLYVGTKNGGLKYAANGSGAFTTIPIEGSSKIEVMDLIENTEHTVAVAVSGGVVAICENPSEPTNFRTVFSSKTVGTGIDRIRLAFASKTPADLFIYASAALQADVTYQPERNGAIYGIYRPYYTKIKNGTVDGGLANVSEDPTNWFNILTSTMTSLQGTSLGYGMAIYINDRDEDNEQIYIGGNSLMVGADYNGEGKFSFGTIATGYTADTLGTAVGISINNILPLPDYMINGNISDSMFLFITSDMGAYRYYYDSVLAAVRWFPANKGMNNLQAYKVAGLADGSVMAATQSNAIVFLPVVKDTVKSGLKVWSVNNPDYPYASNSTADPGYPTTTTFGLSSHEVSPYTYSGSGVYTSSIYRTEPSARKPVLLARPGTNLARTYSYNGDFESVNSTTWTYGHSVPQTLIPLQMSESFSYDQFNTPIAIWESFDYNGTNDSIALNLSDNTVIYPGKKVPQDDTTDFHSYRSGPFFFTTGRIIREGDSVLVQSDNLGYPFFHVFTASDTTVIDTLSEGHYTLGMGNGDTLLYKRSGNIRIMGIPEKVQSRAIVATNLGAYMCADLFNFNKTIDTVSTNHTDLVWAKIYNTKNTYSTQNQVRNMDRRINAVALANDGNNAFIAVDVYGSDGEYTQTNLIRVSGFNDFNLSNDRVFVADATDARNFTADTIATFDRYISSIVCNPKNANDLILTFDGVIGFDASTPNVMRTTKALTASSNADFEDISLKIDRTNKAITNAKPVFTALYESVNNGKGSSNLIYVGSDDGIYVRSGNSWTVEEDVPNVAVYDLWQQSKKLRSWQFDVYTESNAETMYYKAPENTGVIYAATYGKGLLVNNKFADQTEELVSLESVANNQLKETLSVYPNPASDEAMINYTLEQPSEVTFKLFDLSGREVSEFACGRQSKGLHIQKMDVQHLQRGIYMIQMVSGNTSKSAKLIVQ